MQRKFLALVISAVFLSGCFLNDDVRTDQQGVIVNGGKIEECVPPGVYTRTGFYQDLREVNMGTMTIPVDDPEIATADNQLVGMTVVIQARRNVDCTSLTNMLTNWPSLLDDKGLSDVVTATANEAMKNGTRDFTLQGLLDDRNGLAGKIQSALEEDAAKYSVTIINVSIKNIALDPQYAAQLQEKALLTAQTETELKRQELIKQQASNQQLEQSQRVLVLAEQLKAEQAQTGITVEIATREGQRVAAENSVYLVNAAAFELEKLRLLREVLGDQQVIYFVPEGTDLTLLLSQLTGSQTVVPVNPR